jgi:CRP/FNR family transcriptional regulator, cyclic AMP receptor protein
MRRKRSSSAAATSGVREMTEDLVRLFENESEVETLAPGQVLFEKGALGNTMCVLKSGELQIVDGSCAYETVSAGGIVGELALVDTGPRSATVRASKQSVVIPINKSRFMFMVQQTPFFALRVMRIISARLRAMNERATELRVTTS